ATRIYEDVVRRSDDPELAHALAQQYSAAGRVKDAEALLEKARARYAELLRRYPEAMYWHASEFHLRAGDPAQALVLLEKNAALRPNSGSLVALARAELANGLLARARASIDRALAMPLVSAPLFFTASRVYASAGDTAASNAYRARAEKVNPRIAAEERTDARGGAFR